MVIFSLAFRNRILLLDLGQRQIGITSAFISFRGKIVIEMMLHKPISALLYGVSGIGALAQVLLGRRSLMVALASGLCFWSAVLPEMR
jgi:hypothetical protein